MSDKTDAELLLQAVHGDHRAFADLFDRHGSAVQRCARVVLTNADDVAEVVQDVFLLAWKKGRSVTVVSDSIAPWLLVTCPLRPSG